MHNIRAITLDLDDTLWPIGPVIELAEIRLYEWLSRCCPDLAPRYSVASMRAHRVNVARLEKDIAHDLTELRRRSLHRIIVGEGAYPDALVDQAMSVFLTHRNDVRLFPDARPFLQRAASVYPLLSISNGNADLRRIGLAELFVGHVSAREVGAAKPDGRVFRAASERLGLVPSQILHIGDHPEQDILGAARLGMKTAWVNRSGTRWAHGPAPDYEIGSLEQLLPLLPNPPESIPGKAHPPQP